VQREELIAAARRFHGAEQSDAHVLTGEDARNFMIRQAEGG
jgi:hypothetical protein